MFFNSTDNNIFSIDAVSSISSDNDIRKFSENFRALFTSFINKIEKCDDSQILDIFYGKIKNFDINKYSEITENHLQIMKKLKSSDRNLQSVADLGKILNEHIINSSNDEFFDVHDKNRSLDITDNDVTNKEKKKIESDEVENDSIELKKKLSIRKIQAIFMQIAKEMDPKIRAGETKDSNKEDSEHKGREFQSGGHGVWHAVVMAVRMSMAFNDMSQLLHNALHPEEFMQPKKSDDLMSKVAKHTMKEKFRNTSEKEKSSGRVRG